MKERYDTKQWDEVFEVGDLVYSKLQPHCQLTVSQKMLFKPESRYYGLFRVEKQIGEVAYRLELPSDAQIHPFVHVSQLKKRLGPNMATSSVLPSVNANGYVIVRPRRALDYRQVKKGGML